MTKHTDMLDALQYALAYRPQLKRIGCDLNESAGSRCLLVKRKKPPNFGK